jgi:hypothetical protein
VILARKSLTDSALSELVSRGFSICNTEVARITLAEILMEQEDSCNLSYCHNHLGYQEVGKKLYFFGNEEVSGQLSSRYIGHMALSRCGLYADWRAAVNRFLGQNSLLALPLAMGVSAPIATRLKYAGVLEETALWGLIGATSTGKTSCLRLSASPWGKPSADGIIDNLTGTEKYFFASLANHNGMPNFIDETSAVTWDFTKAVYTVALSREGGRCNTDGSPKPRKTWSGAVIFTGETSMFHRTNGNGGLHARLVEFDFGWFTDEKLPNEINRFVSRNYGTAYVSLIAYITSLTDDMLIQQYDDLVREIKKAIALREGFTMDTWFEKRFTGIQGRIIYKLAVLLLSVNIMTLAWALKIDRGMVVNAIIDAYCHNASRVDKIDEFVEAFTQYLARYRNDFPAVAGSRYSAGGHTSAKGYQDTYNNRNCVWVLAEVFEEELLKRGLDASGATLHEIHRRGFLEHFKDRFRKPYKVGKLQPACYCFYPDNSPTTPLKQKKIQAVGKQRKSLLED